MLRLLVAKNTVLTLGICATLAGTVPFTAGRAEARVPSGTRDTALEQKCGSLQDKYDNLVLLHSQSRDEAARQRLVWKMRSTEISWSNQECAIAFGAISQPAGQAADSADVSDQSTSATLTSPKPDATPRASGKAAATPRASGKPLSSSSGQTNASGK